MEEQSIWTAVITLITVLGGGSAWRFYEKRAMKRLEKRVAKKMKGGLLG